MKINIDKLFRNTINGSKPTAPKEIWFAIEAELKRKLILRFLYMFFWVGLISLTGYLFLFSETERNPIIKIQKATSQEELISLPQEKIPEKVSPLTTKKSNSPVVSFPKKYKRNYSKKSFASLSDQNNKSSEKASFFEKKVMDTVIEKQVRKIDSLVNNLDSLVDHLKKDFDKERKRLLTEANKKNSLKKDSIDLENSKKVKGRKWNIIPVYGILNTGRFSKNTSTLGESFNENTTAGLVSNFYGFNLVFRASERVSVQTGIFSKEIRFITKGLFLNNAITNYDPSNIVYNPGVDVQFSTSNIPGSTISTNASLIQTIVYMEMPFEIKYEMFRKSKINSNFIGGFSFLYLNKNEIEAETDLFLRNVGQTNNILNTSVSINLGLDFEYHLSKSLFFNSAVIFKKHYNTYENYNNKTAPYTIGIHAGIGYKF
jgi:hypothetical protein